MIEKKEAEDANDYYDYYYDTNGNGRKTRQNPVVGDRDSQYIKEFYRCLILLNSQETRSNAVRVSVAKDYFQNAAEICYLGKSI